MVKYGCDIYIYWDFFICENFYILIIIMPIIAKNKMTTSRIFYNRGVPNKDHNFAYLATLNYSVLKQLSIYNKNNGISQNVLFKL
jgi:hypothetical protein